MFGAFVRLSHAGLSCPDWPTCYGQLTWPTRPGDIASANAAFERPVEVGKAWREQLHRMIAGALMLATFFLAALGWRARRMSSNVPWRATLVAVVLIVLQALLGMWTVTLKLKPVIVMAHLLGGMATLALLVWIATRLHCRESESEIVATRSHPLPNPSPGGGGAKRAAVVVGIALVAIQIALGGWTSANYAALACGFDFPKCLGEWWPALDFRNAFVLWRGVGVDYEGGVLDGPARAAIQLVHRLFAILVAGHLLSLGARLARLRGWRVAGWALIVLVIAQVLLGIGNVRLGLPLPIATLHNLGAALLLALLAWTLARLAPTRAGRPA